MTKNVISVEHLTKKYDLGVIGTGLLIRDESEHGLMDGYPRQGNL